MITRLSFDTTLGLKYDKKVLERVFKIETDEFEICKAKRITKRKLLLFQQVFIVHVKRDGTVSWEELK